VVHRSRPARDALALDAAVPHTARLLGVRPAGRLRFGSHRPFDRSS